MPCPSIQAFWPVLGAALLLAEVRSEWNVRQHIPLEKFTVQSHRGAGALMPENSVEAFTIAWRLGTVPEADLRTTSDGVIVAFHDDDFRRVLPDAPPQMQAKRIGDVTFAQTQTIDIGSWRGRAFERQRIPKLTDVYAILEKFPRRRLYIDVKDVDLVQLARESQSVHKQLILASTDYGVIRRWKQLAPAAQTLHWMGGEESSLATRLARLRKAKFADIDQLQIHVRILDSGEMKPREQFLLEVGEELREHGILFQALPWETRDPRVYARLMDLGVASFATDYPDVAMRAIRAYYENDADRQNPPSSPR